MNIEPSFVCEVPVVYILYNRPQTVRKTFAAIRSIQPKTLFLIADGPKNDLDALKVSEARKEVEHIDWDCTVIRIYASDNMGCANRITSGLSTVFDQVDSAIILEDDILASESFFHFAQHMLIHYADDPDIMMISGWNTLVSHNAGTCDAFLSKTCSNWGWATWKRAWQRFCMIPELSRLSESEQHHLLRLNHDDDLWVSHNLFMLRERVWERYDAWDYQWVFSIYLHRGFCVTPALNLCRNVGFDADATHTSSHPVYPFYPIPDQNDRSFQKQSYSIMAFDDPLVLWYDRASILSTTIWSYGSVRLFYLYFRNPSSRPSALQSVAWDNYLQPFYEVETSIEILNQLATRLEPGILTEYIDAFEKARIHIGRIDR